MKAIDRLYGAGNYNVQKSINIDNELYEDLKKIKMKYDATISAIINVCIEDLLESNDIKYYAKPKGEITVYRSVMIRIENIEKLERIRQNTGITVTRLINFSIKRMIDKYK